MQWRHWRGDGWSKGLEWHILRFRGVYVWLEAQKYFVLWDDFYFQGSRSKDIYMHRFRVFLSEGFWNLWNLERNQVFEKV